MTRAEADQAIREAAQESLKHRFGVLLAADSPPSRDNFVRGCDEIIAAEAWARKILTEKFT